jgi:hypothetical protein
MSNLVTDNLKKAQQLLQTQERLNSDLQKLQQELSYIADSVNKKVQELEFSKAESKLLQQETSNFILSGKWTEKEVTDVLSGTPATSASVILPSLDRNSLWNFLKNTFSGIWNFFAKTLKPKNPSGPAE